MNEENDTTSESLRALELLERMAEIRDSLVPNESKLTVQDLILEITEAEPVLELVETPKTTKDVLYALSDVWVSLDDAHGAIKEWMSAAVIPVGFELLEVKLRHAMQLVDDVICELEEPQPCSMRRKSR